MFGLDEWRWLLAFVWFDSQKQSANLWAVLTWNLCLERSWDWRSRTELILTWTECKSAKGNFILFTWRIIARLFPHIRTAEELLQRNFPGIFQHGKLFRRKCKHVFFCNRQITRKHQILLNLAATKDPVCFPRPVQFCFGCGFRHCWWLISILLRCHLTRHPETIGILFFLRTAKRTWFGL